jgi:hypothetical protein
MPCLGGENVFHQTFIENWETRIAAEMKKTTQKRFDHNFIQNLGLRRFPKRPPSKGMITIFVSH